MAQPIKNCYVSAPFDVDTSVLRASLLERSIEVLTPLEAESMEFSAVGFHRRLRAADLVVAVLTGSKKSRMVFFDLGQAEALGKRILIIATAGSDDLPVSLQQSLVLRTAVDNKAAIDFALEQILLAPSERRSTESRKPTPKSNLGPYTDALMAEFESWSPSYGSRQLEQIVKEAIARSGTDVVVSSESGNRGVDLVVWSDALGPLLGNPLLIEVKSKFDRRSAGGIVQQLMRYLRASGSKFILLLYGEGPPADSQLFADMPGSILVSPLRNFLESLRQKTFDEVILDIRNANAHGARGKWSR